MIAIIFVQQNRSKTYSRTNVYTLVITFFKPTFPWHADGLLSLPFHDMLMDC